MEGRVGQNTFIKNAHRVYVPDRKKSQSALTSFAYVFIIFST